MEPSTARPVVVGVDGSPASLRALDLAIHEAVLRRTSLRIISTRVPDGSWHEEVNLKRPQLDPQRVVALSVALASRDDLPLDPIVHTGLPTSVLIEASADACLTVVGHRGGGGFPGLAAGSVSKQVAARGSGPVIVTRGPADALNLSSPVLLGVDITAPDEPAIAFAFSEAALRGVPLRALYAPPDGEQPGALRDVIEARRARHPDVALELVVADGAEAPTALLTESSRVGLAVIGQCQRHAHRLGLGSVGETLIHQGACPVAVVHG